MKFTNLIFCLVFLVFSCTSRGGIRDYPPYKLIIEFGEHIKPETGLVLSGYGVNVGLPKDYKGRGIGNFRASFKLPKMRSDEISLDYARNLIVFLGERFLGEINSNSKVRPDLDFYPFTSDFIDITIHFKDENQIDLGQGVALIYFRQGRIVYEGYKISEYTNRFPAIGKHFTIHEESYAEALDIVKKQKGI